MLEERHLAAVGDKFVLFEFLDLVEDFVIIRFCQQGQVAVTERSDSRVALQVLVGQSKLAKRLPI